MGTIFVYFNKSLIFLDLPEVVKAIKISFSHKVKRVWVHTCSLDHKNALNNYLSRGMKVFLTETVQI